MEMLSAWLRFKQLVPCRSQLRTSFYRLRFPRATIGSGTRTKSRLHISGPGRVQIGADCIITSATIWTLRPDSKVTIGRGCYINGTDIAASDSVTIGDRCEISDASIMDTDFHSLQRSPRGPVKTSSVRIGDDVWIAARAGILRGATVGDRSVIGFGVVVTGEVPRDHLVTQGSPRMIPLKKDHSDDGCKSN